MSLLSPATWVWHWRTAWEVCEWASGALVVVCAIITPAISNEWKFIPQTCTGVLGGMVLLGKYGTRVIDKGEREERKNLRRRQSHELTTYIFNRHFPKSTGDGHRVTLFVCEERIGDAGCEKVLCIYARRGGDLASTRTWTVDDNDPAKCSGIAGLIWYHQTESVIDAGWDWEDDGPKAEREKFASKMNMTLAQAETLKTKARHVSGVPISLGGKKWGVLLIDSLKDPRLETDPGRKKRLEELRLAAFLVQSILEVAKE